MHMQAHTCCMVAPDWSLKLPSSAELSSARWTASCQARSSTASDTGPDASCAASNWSHHPAQRWLGAVHQAPSDGPLHRWILHAVSPRTNMLAINRPLTPLRQGDGPRQILQALQRWLWLSLVTSALDTQLMRLTVKRWKSLSLATASSARLAIPALGQAGAQVHIETNKAE